MLIVTTSIAKENFCLNVSDKYYQKSASVTMEDTALRVLTPKFQKDDDLEKKEECINRLLILKKKAKVIVNNKAILNNIDYQQDPFLGMKREKETLSLEFEFGSVNHAYFKFNFKMIDGRFQLSSREYKIFNKRNPEIYLKGVDYKKNSISLATFNALEHTEIPVIPLTFESLEKEIKRKKCLKYYNKEYLESFFYVYPLGKTDVTHYNNIAYYLQKAGANKEVVYLLEKILEKFPKRMVAYYNLGDAYWALGEKKKAREAYSTYIKMMKAKGKEKRIPKVVKDKVLGN